jgi:endoglucanase
VRAHFVAELRGLGEIEADRLGGVTCRVRGGESGPAVLLTGHFDEVGFMVQNVTPDGYLQFVPLGGWMAQAALAQRVRVRTRAGAKVTGVITSLPPHFVAQDGRDAVVPLDKMFIDIGARSRREVQEDFGVALGDPVVPDSPFAVLSPHRVMAKAFDNRAGVALAVHAAQRLARTGARWPNRLLVAGTVQEEVGARGASVVAQLARPDIAIVLEGSPADDVPGLNPSESQCALGRGVQVRLYDPTAIMNRRLADLAIALAQRDDIPHQVAVRRSGGTDAKAIHIAGHGVPCVVLGVPSRYIHSPHSVIDPADYLAALALVVAMVEALDAETAAGLTGYV